MFVRCARDRRGVEEMIRFTKMHGLGNDYLVVDGMEKAPPEGKLAALARALSDRHFGIGSDGLILVLPSRAADFRMRVFNSDGSEAEMCGNGIRLFAKYVYERRLTQARELEVETLAGVIRPVLHVRGGRVIEVRVDMGEPRLRRSQIPMKGPDAPQVVGEKLRVQGERVEVTAVSMGNPHCVVFVKDANRAPVAELGPAIEHHDLFPRRTNVEFAQVIGEGEIKMRVWERGAGETLACGTGASAVLVAGVLNKLTQRKAVVHLRGGDLRVSWAEDNHVFTEGPAAEVCTGETRLDEEV
jgi:diaminopimelate epimerase